MKKKLPKKFNDKVTCKCITIWRKPPQLDNLFKTKLGINCRNIVCYLFEKNRVEQLLQLLRERKVEDWVERGRKQ